MKSAITANCVLKNPLLHIVLIYAFPPLSFYIPSNIHMFTTTDAFIAILSFIFAGLVIYASLFFVERDFKKRGLITSLVFAIVIAMSRDLTGNEIQTVTRIDSALTSIFVFVVIIIVVGIVISLKLSQVLLDAANTLLNIFFVTLTGLTIFKSIDPITGTLYSPPEPTALNMAAESRMPNIIFIGLDGYGRADVLRDQYNFNNSHFIDFLEKNGFYVAKKAVSNFPQTVFSLGATLNYNYFQSLVTNLDPENSDRNVPIGLLKQNRIMSQLKDSLGYRIISLSSGYEPVNLRDSDSFLDFPRYNQILYRACAKLPFRILADYLNEKEYDYHRMRVLFSLEQLGYKFTTRSPFFVFSHIISPHPPFVFDKTGNAKHPKDDFTFAEASLHTWPDYKKQYNEQITYISSSLQKTLTRLLDNYGKDSVIIIQGDHGPGNVFDHSELTEEGLKERYPILSAYYFPDGDYSALYPEITPVNSFRVVLNKYFGANEKLLPDKSYYMTWSKPYAFEDVTEKLKQLIPPTNSID